MNRFGRVARETALEAGRYMKRRLGKIKELSFKGEINLVTDVDKKCEALIIKRLKSHFPKHEILAEESGGGRQKCAYRWVIDPLDGTTNYAHSFPFFAVSIALERELKPIVSVVYDPMRDEMFYAELGKGAYLNRKRMHVSKERALSRSLLATGFAYDVKRVLQNNISNFNKFMMVAQAIRRPGSASLDICYVASGRLDGFWEMKLFPWDTAAAALIAKEAGGKVTRFSGAPYSHYDKDVIVSNGKIHKQMIDVLSSKRRRYRRR